MEIIVPKFPENMDILKKEYLIVKADFKPGDTVQIGSQYGRVLEVGVGYPNFSGKSDKVSVRLWVSDGQPVNAAAAMVVRSEPSAAALPNTAPTFRDTINRLKLVPGRIDMFYEFEPVKVEDEPVSVDDQIRRLAEKVKGYKKTRGLSDRLVESHVGETVTHEALTETIAARKEDPLPGIRYVGRGQWPAFPSQYDRVVRLYGEDGRNVLMARLGCDMFVLDGNSESSYHREDVIRLNAFRDNRDYGDVLETWVRSEPGSGGRYTASMLPEGVKSFSPSVHLNTEPLKVAAAAGHLFVGGGLDSSDVEKLQNVMAMAHRQLFFP